MNNLRELTGISHINIYGLLLHLYEELDERNNPEFNIATDTAKRDKTSNLSGLEVILKEIAILRMFELDRKRATIERNAKNWGIWGTLEEENAALYHLLSDNYSQVIEGNFILAFTEGYNMRKIISENSDSIIHH